MSNLKISLWKFIGIDLLHFLRFITGKNRRDLQKLQKKQREDEMLRTEDMKKEILLTVMEVMIPADVKIALDFAIEYEKSTSYHIFKNLQESANQETLLPSEKTQIKLLLNDFRALRNKIIFIENWSRKSAFEFFNELVATGDWNIFFNKRDDYGHDGGAGICDYWVEHVTTNWKVVLHYKSHMEIERLKQKPIASDEIIKRYGY